MGTWSILSSLPLAELRQGGSFWPVLRLVGAALDVVLITALSTKRAKREPHGQA